MIKKCLITLTVAVVSAYAGLLISKIESFQFFGELVSHVDSDEQIVALTFDDGPTPGYTEEILNILADHDVKATFYLVGKAIAENMKQAKLIVEQGHEVGNHSFSHSRMVLKSPAFVAEEVEKTNALISQAGFDGDVSFRPPYGRKLFTLPSHLAKQGITTVTWDVEPDSVLALDASAQELTDHALQHTRPGSIILMHVMFKSRQNSMAAVPGIIAGLKEKGYRFVTVSELLSHAGITLQAQADEPLESI